MSQGNAPGGRSIGLWSDPMPSTGGVPGGHSAGPLPDPASHTGMALTVISLARSVVWVAAKLVLRGGHPHTLGRYIAFALSANTQ